VASRGGPLRLPSLWHRHIGGDRALLLLAAASRGTAPTFFEIHRAAREPVPTSWGSALSGHCASERAWLLRQTTVFSKSQNHFPFGSSPVEAMDHSVTASPFRGPEDMSPSRIPPQRGTAASIHPVYSRHQEEAPSECASGIALNPRCLFL